ncbi:MAG: DUF2589 domain-containing protein [Planctomycetota bacterium]
MSQGSHDLSSLTEAVADAFTHANMMMEEQHLALLERFFDTYTEPDGRASFRAKMVTIRVPTSETDEGDAADEHGHVPVRVPLISLVPANSLKLDEMKVEFSAFIESVIGEPGSDERGAVPAEQAGEFLRPRRGKGQPGVGASSKADAAEPLRQVGASSVAGGSRMAVRLQGTGKRGKDGTNVTISITVKGEDAPEGLARINEQMLKQVP